MPEYDYRNCQSLFGALSLHKQYNGQCQLCLGGAGRMDLDWWRQLSVEQLIGESQGGYLPQIRHAVGMRFPSLSSAERDQLAQHLHRANTVTACLACNSMTSRFRSSKTMKALLMEASGSPVEVINKVVVELAAILQRKQREIGFKISAVREAFEILVRQGQGCA